MRRRSQTGSSWPGPPRTGVVAASAVVRRAPRARLPLLPIPWTRNGSPCSRGLPRAPFRAPGACTRSAPGRTDPGPWLGRRSGRSLIGHGGLRDARNVGASRSPGSAVERGNESRCGHWPLTVHALPHQGAVRGRRARRCRPGAPTSLASCAVLQPELHLTEAPIQRGDGVRDRVITVCPRVRCRTPDSPSKHPGPAHG